MDEMEEARVLEFWAMIERWAASKSREDERDLSLELLHVVRAANALRERKWV